MRHRLIGLATTVLATLAWGVASAQVRVVEAGIVCPHESRGEIVDAPGTEAGFIREIEQGTAFDLPDRTVPTMTDLGFGFRTALDPGVPAQAVVVVVTHPPMGPRGVTREEWDTVLEPGSASLNLFTFEHEYEKVTGPWTFSIELDGVALVSEAFVVATKTGRGRVEQACFQFMS